MSERVHCQVPGCGRTHKPIPGATQWLCGDHYKLVSERTKAMRRRIKARMLKEGRTEFLLRHSQKWWERAISEASIGAIPKLGVMPSGGPTVSFDAMPYNERSDLYMQDGPLYYLLYGRVEVLLDQGLAGIKKSLSDQDKKFAAARRRADAEMHEELNRMRR